MRSCCPTTSQILRPPGFGFCLSSKCSSFIVKRSSAVHEAVFGVILVPQSNTTMCKHNIAELNHMQRQAKSHHTVAYVSRRIAHFFYLCDGFFSSMNPHTREEILYAITYHVSTITSRINGICCYNK